MHSLTHACTHTQIYLIFLKKEHDKITNNLKLFKSKLTSVGDLSNVFNNLSLERPYIYIVMVKYEFF